MSLHRAQVALDVPDSNCLKHGNKLVLHFCKTCNDSGCSKCMQTKHRNHDWCDIEDISDEKQKELERNINKLEKETLPKLKEKRRKTNAGENIDKKEIDRQADTMVTLINKYRENLKTKVDSNRASYGDPVDIEANLDQYIVAIEQVVRNSKKSIATQTKSEIVQGNENVKVVISEVNKSLAEMDRRPVTCFRRGEIDTHVLQRMLGDVESEHDMASDFDDMNLSRKSHYVTFKVKNTLNVGKNIIQLCPIGSQAWRHEAHGTLSLITSNGKETEQIQSVYPQHMSLDKTGTVYMCFADTGWISRLAPDYRIVDLVNIKPLRPQSLCVTQSGDILVALVDVLIKDFDKCKQTYIARLDSLCKEKQKIQFEEDGQTLLFQFTRYVDENRNSDIVVIDHIGEYRGRLYILNNKGVNKHSYNGTSQLDKYDFLPGSVCCDDQCRIIVTDLANSALHLLNPRGELLQLLMTETDGLVHPHSLGLCDGLLWIGTYEGKVIVAEYKA